MYLPQAVSFPPSLGIEWDLSWRVHLGREVQLEPMVVTSSIVVPRYPAVPLRSGTCTGARPDLSREGSLETRRLLPSGMRLGCGNPAHPEVRACDAYWLSYSNIYLRSAFIYLFVCVPATGCIFPAITRNRVGSLDINISCSGRSFNCSGYDNHVVMFDIKKLYFLASNMKRFWKSHVSKRIWLRHLFSKNSNYFKILYWRYDCLGSGLEWWKAERIESGLLQKYLFQKLLFFFQNDKHRLKSMFFAELVTIVF